MHYGPAKERARQAREAPSAEPLEPSPHYPKAKYRRVKVSDRYPHGYEVLRVASAEDEATLSDEWKDSPDEV